MQDPVTLAASGSTLARETEMQTVPFAVPLTCSILAKHADIPDGFRLMEAA
jgi:hypothetical protein